MSPLPPLPGFALALLLLVAGVIALLPSLVIRGLLAPLNPQVVFCGGDRQRRLALTIDDGPSGPGSDALLELLRELQVPATFFLIGSHLPNDPHFPRRALEQGHAIGNHLWIDARSAGLDRTEFLDELESTEQAIEPAAAPQTLHWRWCRPGRALFHTAMLGWLAERRYRLVLGSIFPWDTYLPPLWFVRMFVRLNAHPGGILVLHDTPALSARTQATLRRIIPELRQRGYSFVPLAELLGAPC
ncbi:MAG: polysaccharide deacetylase [Cyanobium sp.]|nr:MAG: polysaccharide deacetylase [Cyanobium sp.]